MIYDLYPKKPNSCDVSDSEATTMNKTAQQETASISSRKKVWTPELHIWNFGILLEKWVSPARKHITVEKIIGLVHKQYLN